MHGIWHSSAVLDSVLHASLCIISFFQNEKQSGLEPASGSGSFDIAEPPEKACDDGL